MVNPETRFGTGLQFAFGVLSIVAVIVCFVVGFSHYLDYGSDRRFWHYLALLLLAFWTAFSCLRTSKRGRYSKNETESLPPPPPPLAATIILVGIGAMFFSFSLWLVIRGGTGLGLYLVVTASGLSVAALVRNYLKLRKEYRNRGTCVF